MNKDVFIKSDFLASYELDNLITLVNACEHQFEFSTVMGDLNHRKSKVLHKFELQPLIVKKVKQTLIEVLTYLNIPPFFVSAIECQLTASNHGDYFRLHNDNSNHAVQTRKLTYVYYFHQEPKGYTGGELSLHTYNKVLKHVPVQNQIIFFPSELMHEVLPVNVESKSFVDSRFTINGWIRAK